MINLITYVYVKKVINIFLDDNKKIIGYGASTKGNIILNYCEIDSKKISTICDGSEFKWNRYAARFFKTNIRKSY